MYTPKAFEVNQPLHLSRFMQRYSFATLISCTPDGPSATHLPVLHVHDGSRHGTLRGHLAKPNPHCELLEQPTPSVVIFSGPHAYISPNDYSGKHFNVPTWNYTAVHAYGQPKIIRDPATLMNDLGDLTNTHEASSPDPWRFDQASETNQGLLHGIVGFTMVIDRLEGKFKCGQNRAAEDREAMMSSLRQGGHGQQELADFIDNWV